MNKIRQWVMPSNVVYVIAFLMFILFVLIELSTLSTRSGVSSKENYLLYALSWPDYVAQSIDNKYLEIQFPYNEELYRVLSTKSENKVIRYESSPGSDYIVVYKQGFPYNLFKFFIIIFFVSIFIINFYVLALILYWLGRGVKRVVRLK